MTVARGTYGKGPVRCIRMVAATLSSVVDAETFERRDGLRSEKRAAGLLRAMTMSGAEDQLALLFLLMVYCGVLAAGEPMGTIYWDLWLLWRSWKVRHWVDGERRE